MRSIQKQRGARSEEGSRAGPQASKADRPAARHGLAPTLRTPTSTQSFWSYKMSFWRSFLPPPLPPTTRLTNTRLHTGP